MRETENSFIVYNIDLPSQLCRFQAMFRSIAIDKMNIDDIACRIINIQEGPEPNCIRIKEMFEEYVKFMDSVKEKNNKNLPIEYQELAINYDDD